MIGDQKKNTISCCDSLISYCQFDLTGSFVGPSSSIKTMRMDDNLQSSCLNGIMIMDDYKPHSYNSLDPSTNPSLRRNQDSVSDLTPKTTKKKEVDSTREQFSEPPHSLQVRIPRDLCKSLKLMSIQDGRPISEIVLECLTSKEMVTKCWINRRSDAA